MKEKRLKETVCGRAVHWISEAGRGRCTGQGVMPAARIQRRIVLYLADQVWWDERAGCETAAGVEAENRRFKKLLAESIRNGVQLKLIEADKPTQNA